MIPCDWWLYVLERSTRQVGYILWRTHGGTLEEKWKGEQNKDRRVHESRSVYRPRPTTRTGRHKLAHGRTRAHTHARAPPHARVLGLT